MPKIIRILNRLAVGGPVLNAAYLTRFMAPEYETILVVGEKEDHEKSAEYLAEQLGIQYITIPGMGRSINPAGDFSAYQKLKKLFKTYKPDIVHTHAAKPGALGRMAASSSKVPAILHTFHGHVFHSYFNSVKSNLFIQAERMLAKKTDIIISISEQQKKELTNDFKIAKDEKFRVVALGFDLDKFQVNQEEKRKRFRIEFNLKDDEIAIGIIGRLVPVKNHYLFLKAIHHVLYNSSKKIKAFIIGDGETRMDLEKLAFESGIPFTTEKSAEHIHPLVFTSWRSDIDTINAGLDIICLTSFNEGTPVSLIEAQAANKPVLSTRVGGIADIVLEGQTALLADVQKTEQYAELLLLMVSDDDLRFHLGKNSSKYVMEKFSYQRLVNDMSQIYSELLQKKK
jgi:glycosyltransferase involved in cell wall biosynthesis